MLIFALHSTSDDWLSNLSEGSHQKCEKMAGKSSKIEMLIFGLHSTSDDWLSIQAMKVTQNAKKNGCQIVKTSNAHFWIMFNF